MLFKKEKFIMLTHCLKFRQKTLDLSTPKVMGVLNVTPDSFSDGGQFNSVDKAIAHAETMINFGVDIIDIGGESTRPNAPIVSTDEELSRVIPVVEKIRKQFGDDIWLSVDTSNPVVMQQSIDVGADIINDVRALAYKGAKQMVAQLNCPVVLMHNRGNPRTMDDLIDYTDVINNITDELQDAITQAVNAGIDHKNIIIDIGMGFAKGYREHKMLINHLSDIIQHFKLPMLFGVSRKRFLGEILGQMQLPYLDNHLASERDMVGVIAHLLAIKQGVQIVRVHDVKNMVQAIKAYQLFTN